MKTVTIDLSEIDKTDTDLCKLCPDEIAALCESENDFTRVRKCPTVHLRVLEPNEVAVKREDLVNLLDPLHRPQDGIFKRFIKTLEAGE